MDDLEAVDGEVLEETVSTVFEVFCEAVVVLLEAVTLSEDKAGVDGDVRVLDEEAEDDFRFSRADELLGTDMRTRVPTISDLLELPLDADEDEVE